MVIAGKIIAVLPARTGISPRSGLEWKSQSYVLETIGNFPKKMCFEVFGADKIDEFGIKQGEVYAINFDINARYSNGRWYNSITAWKAERMELNESKLTPPSEPKEGDFGYGADIPGYTPF